MPMMIGGTGVTAVEGNIGMTGDIKRVAGDTRGIVANIEAIDNSTTI